QTGASMVNRKFNYMAAGSDISKFTMANLASLPSTSSAGGGTPAPEKAREVKTESPMGKYSSRMVEDIINQIFAERRGDFPETSSSCHVNAMKFRQAECEPHIDKRLRYWKEVLLERKKMQLRVQQRTGKMASEVLFNRRATLEHRDEQTVKRVLDYADRMEPEKIEAPPVAKLADLQDPCTCEITLGVAATKPKPEMVGYKNVEIIGLPNVTKRELLGREALEQKAPPGWLQSEFLDERLQGRFYAIQNVLEFFPDLDNLQVTGTNVSKLITAPRTTLVGEESLHTITNTESPPICSEECTYGSLENTEEYSTETAVSAPVIPELGLQVNGVDYLSGDSATGGINECYEIVTRFSCDPFRRQKKAVLQLTNIGQQTLTFSWKQSTYFYNRGSLLLARDNEFLFDLEGFRLAYGESRNLVVLYQPRKVGMAVELWLLHVEPRIFCSRQESLLLRFHGRCTPPADYMAKLLEGQCACVCKSDAVAVDQLTMHLSKLVPLVVPPPACCPYERPLDDREAFNSLNPGYNCTRFDDLEMLRKFHMRLKKPREPLWDFRLTTIKEYVLRVEGVVEREKLFAEFTELLAPLLGPADSLDTTSQRVEEKQRSRFIYVRGVICNGIAEWEELMFNVEDSFFKPELQRFYASLLGDSEEEEGGDEDNNEQPRPAPITAIDREKLLEIIGEADLDETKIRAAVMRKLYHSKYFRDSLYIQTYSHLCNMAEDIVSVIESTEVVPS
ncbi:hypothetical protein KR026_011270, partial [Drosophila bipectinata]